MKIERSILAAFLAAAYLVLKQYFPDFPLTEQILLGMIIWTLGQLGVEVTAPAVRGFLVRRGLMQADLPAAPRRRRR